ncbi:MAG: arginase family protein [Caldilineaceae bacterium]
MLTYTNRPTIYEGVPTFLGVDAARSPADLVKADAAIIGVPYLTHLFGFDADLTPRKIRQASAKYSGGYLPELDVDVLSTLRVVDYGDAHIDPADLRSVENVTAKVMEVLEAGALPITLGGNALFGLHTGGGALTFSRRQAHRAVNLDAHGDNREVWDGSSALGGDMGAPSTATARLCAPTPHADRHRPGNPKANADWFRAQGCGLYTAREMRKLSGGKLAPEVIRRAGDGTLGLWLGIDWDVLDISVSPDWSYPEPLGMSAEEVLHLAFEVGKHGCLGFSTMSSPAHATSMHWIVIWTVLYLLAGVAVHQKKAEASLE